MEAEEAVPSENRAHQNIILVEVVSGRVQEVPTWDHIYVNNEGYLFTLDREGKMVWVQLVNHSKYQTAS